MARADCNLCSWWSQDYESRDAAGCESMWQVFEQHWEVWLTVFGPNRPRDPDPRGYDVRARR